MDSRKHHLSQVIAGWTLGYVIGKRVVGMREGNWRNEDSLLHDWDIVPFVDFERGATGIMFTREF